jgi:hypothetical protein
MDATDQIHAPAALSQRKELLTPVSISLRTALDPVKKRVLQGTELRLLGYLYHILVTVLTELTQLINESSRLQYYGIHSSQSICSEYENDSVIYSKLPV